jgi:hypothetical protein
MSDAVTQPSAGGHEESPPGLDDRWGGDVPWFLRYAHAPLAGDFATFFARVGQRLERLMDFNEVGVGNFDHFSARLETDTLQRFQHRAGVPLGGHLRAYFDPRNIRQAAELRAARDPEEQRVRTLSSTHTFSSFSAARPPPESAELTRARTQANATKPDRVERHWRALAAERLGVLEVLLSALDELATVALTPLMADLRRAAAEAHIPLDLRGEPPRLIALDEGLLQSAVIDPLLGCLQERWPERAGELIEAYHDVLAGRRLDEVFARAYKSLEEIARSVTGDPTFDFSQKEMQKYFPQLHPTIRQTMSTLRDHRDDAASHGCKAPSVGEIRYLLFQICNVALLLLDCVTTSPNRGRSI